MTTQLQLVIVTIIIIIIIIIIINIGNTSANHIVSNPRTHYSLTQLGSVH